MNTFNRLVEEILESTSEAIFKGFHATRKKNLVLRAVPIHVGTAKQARDIFENSETGAEKYLYEVDVTMINVYPDVLTDVDDGGIIDDPRFLKKLKKTGYNIFRYLNMVEGQPTRAIDTEVVRDNISLLILNPLKANIAVTFKEVMKPAYRDAFEDVVNQWIEVFGANTHELQKQVSMHVKGMPMGRAPTEALKRLGKI